MGAIFHSTSSAGYFNGEQKISHPEKIREIVWVKPLKEFKGPTLTPNDQQNSHGSEKNHQSIRVAIDHRSAPMRRPANGLDAVLVSETSRHQQTHIQHRVLETSLWKSILCVHMFVHTYYIYTYICIHLYQSIYPSIYLSIYIYIILYILCIFVYYIHVYTYIHISSLNILMMSMARFDKNAMTGTVAWVLQASAKACNIPFGHVQWHIKGLHLDTSGESSQSSHGEGNRPGADTSRDGKATDTKTSPGFWLKTRKKNIRIEAEINIRQFKQDKEGVIHWTYVRLLNTARSHW